MNRRQLLIGAALAPLAGLWPLAASAQPDGEPRRRRLLLVELNGGNDSLAMFAPYTAPQLPSLRGALLSEPDQMVKLSDRMALHPALAPLHEVFVAKELALVMGLGYANTNRSHFASIEVWDSASTRSGSDGWLTRLGAADSSYAAPAIVIGRNPAPVSGATVDPIVISTAQRFVSSARRLTPTESSSSNPALKHVLQLQQSIEQAADGLAAQRPAAPGEFPRSALGRDLAEAARLLIHQPAAPIVKVALTGFDTHVSQAPKHALLMRQLGEGLAAFRRSLIEAGAWRDTLVLTYSEFGRRVRANGNNGTDHGTAATHLVMGGGVRGGLLGEIPDLARLDGDDLRVTTDFRCLYNSVLADWFGRSDAQIEAQRYRKLELIRA